MLIQTFAPGLTILTAESPEDRIVRFLRTYNGVSLQPDALFAAAFQQQYQVSPQDALKLLTGRNVDPSTTSAFLWKTNCATSALGFMAAACVTIEAYFHELLRTPSQNGTSIDWIYRMGRDLKCIRPYKLGQEPPKKGNLLGFASGQHVEWALSDADAVTGQALHGGGGRANNAITVGVGDVRSSVGRPLTDIFDFCQYMPASPDAATGELDAVLTPTEDGNAVAEGG